MKRILLIAVLMIGSTAAKADLMFDISAFYDSKTSGNVSYASKDAALFIAMPIAVKEQLYFGPDFGYTEDNSPTGGTTRTEIGPRINYYMNADKTFLVSLAWHPYVSFGTGGEGLSGWGYTTGLGYEFKLNNNFFIGASIVYHSMSTTVDATNVTTTTSSLRPMLNFSFRFK